MPDNVASQIVQLAETAGGYVVTSQIATGETAGAASLTICVPAEKFDEVRTRIRKLGLRVESESIEAQDVTKQYVDQEARLRNLRAEEQQYLAILRKAATVKDTLEVSDKLNEVRGGIEERQAEFKALSKQVETVAINITLRAEADTQVFGLNWRPLYQLKIAAREGLSGLADYAASMTAFVFYLPTVLLWLFTILSGAAVGWRVLRWAAKVLFALTPKGVREHQVWRNSRPPRAARQIVVSGFCGQEIRITRCSLVTTGLLSSPSGLNLLRKFNPHFRSTYKTRQAASLRNRSGGLPRPSQPQPEEKGTCTNFSPRSPVLYSALHFPPPRRTTAPRLPSPFTTRISSSPAIT